MIFLDTSAVYALADKADPNHETAVSMLNEILVAGEELLTHSYVLLESIALLQSRLGLAAATKFARESDSFVIEWIDRNLHQSGVQRLTQSRKRQVSLVDQISFLVMRRRNVSVAFAFDPDFVNEGFQLFNA